MKALFPVFLVLGAAIAHAADPVGQSIAVQGKVTAQAPSAAVRTLEMKGGVFMQDAIRTAPDSKTQLLFADDTVFSQGPNMEVTIDEFVYDPVNTKNNAFKAKVERGVFRTVTGKITDLNPDKFEIKTGRATIGIRGCAVSARLSDRRDEISIDYVRTGRVVVVTPFGGQPVEFREPGLVVIEDGGRVRKQRFDPVRFAMNLGETMPGDAGPGGGSDVQLGGGFRKDANLIQGGLAGSVGQAPPGVSPPPPSRHHSQPPPPPPPPEPWPVLDGTFSGFAANQVGDTLLNINPLDSAALDPLHATENMSLVLHSEQTDPAAPGGKLYDWPYSVSVPPATHMPLFGSADPDGTVTSERLDADTFQVLMVGAGYNVTMRIRHGGPNSDWYRAWWGMDKNTPAQVLETGDVGDTWVSCQGFGVVGNTYTAAETADLKNGSTSYNLVQTGSSWAGGVGHFSWYENNTPSSGSFAMQGAPVGTTVHIGNGQDTWSTRLQLHSTGASQSPAQCDVDVTGSLLDANQKFNATITPTVNTMTLGGHDYQQAQGGAQTFGVVRLVGSKQPGTLPTGLIGSMTLSGFRYNTAVTASYQMNLHFGTDLKKFEGGRIQ